MADLTWQASAMYVTSFVQALKEMGHLAAVTARLEPRAAEMVKAPHAQGWWAGAQLISLLEAVEAEAGLAAVKEAGLRGSHQRMGPVVRPLAGVLLSLSKVPAAALLSRLGNFVSAGVRGIDARFVPAEGKPGGVVTFTFPEPVPTVMAAVWFGLFDVGFTLAKSGRVVSEQVSPTVHRYEVTW
ncbi:MAG: hypothetical protein Q8L48_13145 [Archangium sp.]|nr:hypothetical protein [Archangium sp.]